MADDLERNGPNGGGYIRVPIRDVLDGMDRKLDRIERKVDERTERLANRIGKLEHTTAGGAFTRSLWDKTVRFVVLAVIAGIVSLVVNKGGL